MKREIGGRCERSGSYLSSTLGRGGKKKRKREEKLVIGGIAGVREMG